MTDICFIAEGSYPYIKGGVSSWIQQLIEINPDFTFEIVSLVADKNSIVDYKYDIPKNVKKIHNVLIKNNVKKPIFMPNKLKFSQEIINFEKKLNIETFSVLIKKIQNTKNKITFLQRLLYSEESFNLINKIYIKFSKKRQYIEFFWGFRDLIHGFANVITADIPKAKVYHSVSTGYAGLYAAACKIKYPKARVILTEHGIYTRERKMDIAIIKWADYKFNMINPTQITSVYREMWDISFHFVSKMTYYYADEIYSLNEKNNKIQLKEGANKVSFVRNGISLKKFKYTERKTPNLDNIKIGFLGRVVKIKDIKTFIKSAIFFKDKYPNAQFLIAGPTNEEPQYYKSCLELIEILDLKKNVKFLGTVNSADFFQEIDILVLTSLSEGQPLVISEANACGVPCIATDVGGCREMLEGGGEDNLGISGYLTHPLNYRETSQAIIDMIKLNKYEEFSKIGYKRAVTFYNEEIFKKAYKKIYITNMEKSWQE